MLRRVRGLIVVLAVVSLAACSSDEASDGGAVTTLEAVTTTEATTTTTEVSNTTESTEPEPEWTPEELEVIEAWEAYRSFWELAIEDQAAALEVAPSVMIDGQLESMTALLEGNLADGVVIRGSSDYEVVRVVVGEPASVFECGIGGTELVDADGDVVVPATFEQVEYELGFVRGEDGSWLVAGRRSLGSC